MSRSSIAKSVLAFSSFVFCSVAFGGGNSGITYQGRILKPDGTPLAGANVQFRLQIRTPNSNNCLMYEEAQSIDMRNSGGQFSLTINDGSGSRMDTTGLGLDRLFENRGSFTFAPATCQSGSTYTPTDGDGRNLVVLFKDETMAAWEPIPAAKINYVPYAFSAQSVQGFAADSLLRVVDGSGDPLTGLAPLSNAQYTALMDLLNGSSSAYTKAGQLNGVALPTMTTGEVLGWNGTTWVSTTSTPGANSVTTTMIQNGAVDGTKLDPAISISTSGMIASAVTTTRDFKIYAASPSNFYVGMLADPTLAASYTLTWPLTAGSANQVLTTDGSGKLTWTTPSSAGITDLTGDVTATGPGSAAATVVSVGGVTAVNVASGATAANDATSLNMPNTIVKRDGTGGFAAGAVSATSVSSSGTITATGAVSAASVTVSGAVTGGSLSTSGSVTQGSAVFNDGQLPTPNTVTLQAPANVTSSYVLKWPTSAGGSGDMLTTDASGNLSWVTPSGAPTGAAGGDLTGSYPNPSVATVGTSTAANIHSAEVLANAATDMNTPNTIIKRDGAGGFAAGVVTAASVDATGVVSGGSLSSSSTITATGGISGASVTATGAVTGASVKTNSLQLDNGVSLIELVNPPLSAAYTLTLPTGTGTSGQVLTTNGSGVTSWTTPLSDTTAFVQGGNMFGANADLGTNDGFDLNLRTGGTTKMTVTSGGNVGIGTTSPSARLEVNGDFKANDFTSEIQGGLHNFHYDSDSAGDSTGVFEMGSYKHFIGTGFTPSNMASDGTGIGLDSGTGKMDFYSYGVNVMRLSDSGRVGIGTTSPLTKLDVAGSLRVGDGAETCNASLTGAIRYNGGNLQFCAGSMPWTTLGAAGAGISSLTGDVTGSGPGATTTTVVSVGGSSAADVHSAELLANAATDANTASTIVKRDGSGGFSAGAISATSVTSTGAVAAGSVVYKDSISNTVTVSAPTSVTSSYVLKWPTSAGGSNDVLKTDASGNLSWASLPTALPPNGAAGGDLTGTYPNPSVATVGTSTAANIHSAELLANAATAANTVNAIVKRDGSGNFTASDITASNVKADALHLNNAGSIIDVVNPGATYTLTLPTGSGTNGQVLTTNGSGVTSWTTPLTGTTGFVQGGNTFGAAANLGTNDNFDLNLKTNNLNRMTVTAFGYVGIGTTNPLVNLQINNVGPVSTDIKLTNANTGSSSGDGLVISEGSDSNASITNLELGYLRFGTNNVERMRIDASGNIGIGTTSPNGKLDVKGSIVMSGATSGFTGFQPSATAGSTVYTLPSSLTAGGYLTTDGAGNLTWSTPAGTGVTSVTSANADIGVANTTTTPVLTLNSGTGPDQILKLDGSSKIPAVDGSQLTNLNASSFTSGTLPVSRGGTGTTSFANYSVIASDISGNQVAVPGSTSNTMLQWDVTGPKWSTAVWPSSTTANQLLYSSANNVVGQLATAADGVLVTDGSGVPSIGSSLPSAVQGNITSVGTITSGTWSGSAIAANHGGTGQTAYTVGDILYADTTSTLAKLPAGASGRVLTSNGAAAPSWESPSSGMGGTGTANYLAKFTAGTTLANSVLYETGGKVGIGTTSTAYKLDVTGDINTSTQLRVGTYPALKYVTGAWNGLLSNVFVGTGANHSSVSGDRNVALGTDSGKALTSGGLNTLLGYNAGGSLTTGPGNTFVGNHAAYQATTADNNEAIGTEALSFLKTGMTNVGISYGSGGNLQSGDENIFIGNSTGGDGNNVGDMDRNVVIGHYAGKLMRGGTSGNGSNNNILLGWQAGDNITTGDNNIIIGHDIDAATATTSNFMSLGNMIYATGLNGTGTTVSTGNVGIGTTSPTYKLDVAGDINVTGNFKVNGVNIATGGGDFMKDGSVAMTGPLKAATGSAAAPSITFASDSDTGLYSNATDRVAFAAGGAKAFEIIGTSDAYISNGILRVASGSPAAPGISFENNNKSGLYSPAGFTLGLVANNIEAMRVDSAGNVGVGTTSPGYKFDVNGIANATQLCIAGDCKSAWPVAGGSGDFKADGSVPMTGALQAAAGTGALPSLTFDGDTDTGFYSYTGNAIGVAVGGSARMRFTSGGIISETGGAFAITNGFSAANPTYSFVNDNDTGLFHATTDSLGVSTAGAERVRVDASGNVGIGTTSPAALLQLGNPASKLGTMRLAGNTSGYVQIQPSAAAGSWTMTLPSSAGSNGQVLSTNGSGVLSWATASGGATKIDDLSDAASSSVQSVANLFMGAYAGENRTTGASNTAIGYNAGSALTTGTDNTIVGAQYWGGTGPATHNETTAIGANTLYYGVDGDGNTVVGAGAGDGNDYTIGEDNTYVGRSAGGRAQFRHTYNVGVGSGALSVSSADVTIGIGPDAGAYGGGWHGIHIGDQAGYTASGDENIFIGSGIFFNNGGGSTGEQNTIVGNGAASQNIARTGSNNAMFGYSIAEDLSSGSNNTVMGYYAAPTLTTGSNNIVIGSGADIPSGNTSNFLNIGNTIYGNTSTGNVGIGTSSPSQMLTINGSQGSPATSGTTQNGMFRLTNTTGQVALDVGINQSGTAYTWMQATQKNGLGTYHMLALNPNGGNVGIGVSSPTQKLTVAGNIAPSVTETYSLGTSSVLFLDAYVKNGVTTTSDERKKTDITNSDLGLDFINDLRPVSYHWKEGDKRLHYGVIAQETERALSQAKTRSGRSGEVDNVIVSHDKKTDIYGVRYTELIAPVIKAIQELYAEFVGVKGDVEALKDQTASRMAKIEAENQQLKQENAEMKARLDKIEKALSRAPAGL